MRRLAIAEPPTDLRPPDLSDDTRTKDAEWAECLVKFEVPAGEAEAQEVWVFRKRDFEEFQRLIGLRLSYRRPSPSSGGSTYREDRGPTQFGEARRQEAMTGTTVTCREREIDPDLVCADCVKVFTGGPYKEAGIAVPAYPRQPEVLGCLALSIGEVNSTAKDGYSPMRQTAFCNYVNARFIMG